MSDSLEGLSAALADRYTIERELGRGGMAVVYLAYDLKHDRKVAIKVLRPELAATLGAERFLREIKIAARLNHPHILPLLDSGTAEEQPSARPPDRPSAFLYYVMPYIEGESLRDRITRERQLPIEDALRLAREVASALSYAHSQGVIHRDIKPENVMLSAGGAVVADFGIARAVDVAGGEQLTETGMAVGTPAYMSPEQATAEPVDARSDIYSLGCVLYEMLGGEPPFIGATPQSILARKLAEPVPSLRAVRETVAEEYENVVMKALARAPADRFTTAMQLEEALKDPASVTPLRTRVVAVPAKRLSAAIISIAVIAVVVVAISVGRWLTTGPGGGSGLLGGIHIAVLPCDNLSGDEEQAYYADGIAREINLRLAKLGGFAVTGHRSAQRVLDEDKSYGDMASQLGVEYLVECGVARANGAVQILASLVDPETEGQPWGDVYPDIPADSVNELSRVQADIVQQIASALNVVVSAPEQERIAEVPTDNAEAYDAYLHGNQYPTGGAFLLPTDRRDAIALYQRAVDLDPFFAEAHARLSTHYSMLARIGGEFENALTRAKQHADSALALDPDLALGHLANVMFIGERYRDPELQLPHLTLALQVDSTSSEIQMAWAGYYAWMMGDLEQAVPYYERAFELDPLEPEIVNGLGTVNWQLGRYAEAEPLIERAIELAPGRADLHALKTWLYLAWQGVDSASAALQAAVPKVGRERMIVGFLQTHWWGSRMLATDEWYRQTLEGFSLGPPGLDSAFYYLHKAALFDGRSNRGRAIPYYDSATAVLTGRAQPGEGFWAAQFHADLGVAYAGMGNQEEAVRELRQVIELSQELDPVGVAIASGFVGLIYAMTGEFELAVPQFQRSLSVPSWIGPGLYEIDPALEPMRELPAFRELISRDW